MNTKILNSCDDTHLRGMRGTAVGVEAAVMTCKICSRADRPPPTWKATWSALFCWGEDRERARVRKKQRCSQGTASSRPDRGLHSSCWRRSLSFSYRGKGLKCETKWSLKYSCLISKVHNLTPPHNSELSVKGKMLCRLRLASGWSQWITTG